MTIEQDIANLQKQIDELKGETKNPFTTAVTKNPFTKLDKLSKEQGSTGDATYRILDIPNRVNDYDTDIIGAFLITSHVRWLDGASPTRIWGYVPLPTDYISGGFPTINMLYSASTTDSFDFKFTEVYEIKPLDNDETIIYSEDYVSYSPAAANTLYVISKKLTVIPSPGSFIGLACRRDGIGDTSSGTLHTWAIWLNYLAYN